MATREIAGTTPFGMGRAALAGMVAVAAGLAATIIVAAAIALGSSSSSGTYTLGPSDDWGTRHRGAVPAAAPAPPAVDTTPGLLPGH